MHSAHVPFILCSIFLLLLDFVFVVSLFCSLFNFSNHLLFNFCFIRFFCFSLLIVSLFKEKRFNSDPGLYSRYFDPAVLDVQELSSSSMQVNKHNTSDFTDFVLV